MWLRPGTRSLFCPAITGNGWTPKTAARATLPHHLPFPGARRRVITGSEVVKTWEPYQGDVWVARIPNGLFGNYNPYTTLIEGDWYIPSKPFHTGEVYLNGEKVNLKSPRTPSTTSWPMSPRTGRPTA